MLAFPRPDYSQSDGKTRAPPRQRFHRTAQRDDRPLPADTQAERSVLGSILLERTSIVQVASWLTPQDFYLEKHALIYAAALLCYQNRVPPDLTTIADALRVQQQLDQVGGITFLGELHADAPAPIHIDYYAQIVQRTARHRRLIAAGAQISAAAYDETIALADHEASAQQLIQEAVAQPQRSIRSAADIGMALQDELARGRAPYMLTGLRRFDMFHPFYRGGVTVIGARPGAGKTDLACNILYRRARAQERVALLSIEMPDTQIQRRLTAIHMGVARDAIYDRDDPEPFQQAQGYLSTLPYWVEDFSSDTGLNRVTAERAATTARRLAHEHDGLDWLIVDYLQLLTLDQSSNNANRNAELGVVMKFLCSLAKQLDCCVIALSQLRRPVKEESEPTMTDLRDSGEIEQDATAIILMSQSNDVIPPDNRLITIPKNRHGVPNARFSIYHQGSTGRFIQDQT